MLWAMVLVPILTGVAFFVLFSSHQLQTETVRELNAVLSMQQQFIEYYVQERAQDIDSLASDPRVLQLSPNHLREHFLLQLKNGSAFKNIAFVGEDGRIVVDTMSSGAIDVSDREYFRQAKEGRRYVSEALRSRGTGHLVLIVSSPIHDAAGRFRGLVFGSVPLETLFHFMQTMHTETSTQVLLYQADGTLLSPPTESARANPALRRHLAQGDVVFDTALEGKSPEGIYHNLAGDRVVGSSLWVLSKRWLLVAEMPETSIMAVHATVLAVPLMGALVLFLVFGPAALRLARSLEAPLQRLEEHARSIEAGDFEMTCELEQDTRAPEEVRRLNSAYCKMVQRVQVTLDDLRQATLTDTLTGAPNRKRMLQEGPRLIDASLRAGQPVSFLMLDLDHFKNVNDTYGHAAGDEVLRAFSHALGSQIRLSDLYARMGGEEFAVLAPNAGQREALELAERIRKGVEALQISVPGGDLSITASIGVATMLAQPGTSMTLDALVACADKAMYRAKNDGRNRVASCNERN